jgi:(p)ppGpp synthase/HD superfamily hydrolase
MIQENRESFFAELRLLPPSQILDVELAYTMAKFSHRSQVRKELGPDGKPLRYFEHVRRVALILMRELGFRGRDMVIAALLHDGMEDTRDLTPEMIEHTWGPRVTSLVKVLSKVPEEGYLERFMESTDWRAYMIKACDRLDNLRSLGTDVSFRHKQLRETSEKYMPLFDRMVKLTPGCYMAKAELARKKVLMELIRQETLVEVETKYEVTPPQHRAPHR